MEKKIESKILSALERVLEKTLGGNWYIGKLNIGILGLVKSQFLYKIYLLRHGEKECVWKRGKYLGVLRGKKVWMEK